MNIIINLFHHLTPQRKITVDKVLNKELAMGLSKGLFGLFIFTLMIAKNFK